MMNHAGLDVNYRRNFWCETISRATKLDNLMVRKMGGNRKLQQKCDEENLGIRFECRNTPAKFSS